MYWQEAIQQSDDGIAFRVKITQFGEAVIVRIFPDGTGDKWVNGNVREAELKDLRGYNDWISYPPKPRNVEPGRYNNGSS